MCIYAPRVRKSVNRPSAIITAAAAAAAPTRERIRPCTEPGSEMRFTVAAMLVRMYVCMHSFCCPLPLSVYLFGSAAAISSQCHATAERGREWQGARVLSRTAPLTSHRTRAGFFSLFLLGSFACMGLLSFSLSVSLFFFLLIYHLFACFLLRKKS